MMNIRLAKYSAIACLCAGLYQSGEAQQQSEQYNLPYGNFGLDYASNQINNAQNQLNQETGLNFFFDYYATLLTNPYGGQDQATNYNHIMIFGLTADPEKLTGWKGMKFVISGAYNAGGNLANSVGNFFTPSEASIGDGAMFYEMYIAQIINLPWDDSIKVRMGRMSMADTFGSLPLYGYLVSGGMDGTPEAIFYNSPYTSTTVATWGITTQYFTVENLSFAAGLYQISPLQSSANWDGTNMTINSNDGYMAMFQLSWTPTLYGNLSGTYQLGGYFFGGADEIVGYNPNEDRGNGYGFYLQGQQQVWVDESNSNKYITLWAGSQYAPVTSIQQMTWMAYGGIQLQGFVPYREQDGFYVALMAGWFSNAYNDYAESTGSKATYETVIEVTYVYQINDYISIQPDFQYIMRPYGNDNIDDAMVIGGQLLVSF